MCIIMSHNTLLSAECQPHGFKDISLMRIWLMGENLGPGHDVIMPRCNPLALSPISRRLRVSGTGRGEP